MDFLLCGYVLMPDHWHALLGTGTKAHGQENAERDGYQLTISQVLHDIKKVSARRLNQLRGTRGPLWQHQFWDRFVRHEEEFNARMTYMHFNPVRRELVKRPEDWRWSSYSNFASDKATVAACPIQIDFVQLPVGYRG